MNTVLRKIGNSDGVIIPREALDKAGWSTGDAIEVVADGRGGIRLVKATGEFAEELTAAREFMSTYRNALAKLAE